MTKDSLGDYLKSLEKTTTSQKVSDDKWIYIRLDGRSFHTVTKSLTKPYDTDFIYRMQLTACGLLNEFQCDLVMQQSDEISMVFAPIEKPSERIFDGKYHKLLSVIPSYASSSLSYQLDKNVQFDARLVECEKDDIIKFLWWRYKDCKKNAISMVADYYFSNKQLHGMSTSQRLENIKDSTMWMSASTSFKYGFWKTKNTSLPIGDIIYYSEFAPIMENILLDNYNGK